MGRIKFSIITPVNLHDEERAEKFKKCIESVNNQDYDHTQFEHIIVNDGSTHPFNTPNYDYITVVNQPHLERINAYNAGFEKIQGDIIVFVDSDDELEPNALQIIDKAFKKNPTYKMLNFGCTFVHKTGAENKRAPFTPQKKRVGHEVFGGGNIVNGTFVFKKEVFEKLGAFPPMYVEDIDCSEINYGEGKRRLAMSSPWDFSAYAQMQFPEIRDFFFIDRAHDPNKAIKELGNPWGNDYFLFYKYTRKYHSKPVDEYILRVNLR